MTTHHFSGCPFCGQPFEHDGRAFELSIDKQRRHVCNPCVKRLGLRAEGAPASPFSEQPLPKPNGGPLTLRPASELAVGVQG